MDGRSLTDYGELLASSGMLPRSHNAELGMSMFKAGIVKCKHPGIGLIIYKCLLQRKGWHSWLRRRW
jgi:hypothetical protein